MKLGFVTAIVPELSLAEVLNFARGHGYSCVEVMCWPQGKAERKFAGVTHIDVNSLSNGRVEEIHSLCEKYGVSLSGLGYYPNPLDPNPEVSKKCVDHLKKVIVGAKKLGLANVNTFVGRDWTKTIDENWPRFLKIWKPLIAFAADHGIKIGIENCPMSFHGTNGPAAKTWRSAQ